mmetsp:Transcript_38427/g.60775  ORF Transcript_38427/g.60775 Transcript_38427/m.60775 type:complete len:202 (-) Transcript_38427:1728-2333(-)
MKLSPVALVALCCSWVLVTSSCISSTTFSAASTPLSTSTGTVSSTCLSLFTDTLFSSTLSTVCFISTSTSSSDSSLKPAPLLAQSLTISSLESTSTSASKVSSTTLFAIALASDSRVSPAALFSSFPLAISSSIKFLLKVVCSATASAAFSAICLCSSDLPCSASCSSRGRFMSVPNGILGALGRAGREGSSGAGTEGITM